MDIIYVYHFDPAPRKLSKKEVPSVTVRVWYTGDDYMIWVILNDITNSLNISILITIRGIY